MTIVTSTHASRCANRIVNRTIGISRRSVIATIGAGILLIFALLAMFGPWIFPTDPVHPFLDAILLPPNGRFWFGTDGNGMDILTRVVYGSRYAFGIAIPAVAVSVLVGIPTGLVCGYVGGVVDEVSMRIMDAVRIFPTIILALAVVAAAGPSLATVVMVIGALDAPVFVRVVRAEVLALRSGTLVESAIAAGNPTWRVLFIHLLPNAVQGATAQIAVRAAWAVRISATLAFLGVGIQPPTPEWGSMIRQGAELMSGGQWWVAAFPGCALILLVFGFNLLGDGLQDMLDPRRKVSAR